jgi:hypothetical protein
MALIKDSPRRGTLLKALARPWYRGRAKRDGQMIVLERPEPYEPRTEARIGFELARIRTPDDAVSFVSKFGLLGTRACSMSGDWPTPDPTASRLPSGLTAREPFTVFERAAEDLHKIVRTVLDVRKGANGDVAVLEQLRRDFGAKNPDATLTMTTVEGRRTMKARDLLPPEDFAPVDDRTVLTRASDWAAWGLNAGLLSANAWPYVFEPAQLFQGAHHQVGHLLVGVLPETLLGFCYLTVAQALANEPIARCAECQRVFVVDDGRQIFCLPTCASRARFRRFTENNQRKGKAKRHVKATRKK